MSELTAASSRSEACLVTHLFDRHAESSPESPCIRHGALSWTYADLKGRADTLAGELMARGVGPETVIAVFLPRGAHLATALLGTLKAGAAYLPIDVAAPAARVAALLRAANVHFVLTGPEHAERLPARDQTVLDVTEVTARHGSPRTAPVPARPGTLAYVIFTSGSTGQPKPVAVTHRSLANHAQAIQERYQLHAGDRMLQFANPAFDVFAEELYPTLCAGGEVVVVPDPTMPPMDLCRFLDEQGVTVVNLPTSYWTQWTRDLETGAAVVPSHLRLLVVGSEPAHRETLVRWRRHSTIPVINAYGLTETTVTVTTETFEAAPDETDTLPIGRPLAGCTALILDAALLPVPAGTAGELYLGGACLARGYLGMPARTADRFVPHPNPPERGARLYRTGDLVRERPDGALEFLGRLDGQIKVRGHRIEPAEVAAALTSHPLLAQAYVSTDRDAQGAVRLVGYVVPGDSRRVPSGAMLRAHLSEQLPAYMVPQAFVVLDALPLTPTGKVDSRALPPVRALESAAPYVAPEGALEERLAEIWREVLGLPRVGREDDLFDLGGHSLTVARIAARIRAELGNELGVPDLFDHPTIAVLAAWLAGDDGSRPALPAITPHPGEDSAPLSYQQLQMWFLTKLAPNNIAYHAQTTIRVVGAFDLDVLDRTVTEIGRRHEILRTTYHERDGEPRQVVQAAGPVAVRRVDLTGVPAAERAQRVEELVQEELHQQFDLTRLPLLRWTAIQLAPDEYELVLVEHHLVHDGWSFALLMRELREVYGAFASGRGSPLPELSVQYRDFARWQREAMDSKVMRAQLEYWREHLANLPPALALPQDFSRPAVQTYRGETLRIELPPTLPSALRTFCRAERVTLYTAMYAAFVVLLRRYSGERDVCVGSAYANRQSHQTQDVIGMLVNPVLLRLAVDDGQSFRELAGQARGVVLGASRNQELPFPVLVRELNPARDVTGNPLVRILFSANDSPMPQLDLGGATGTVYERGNGSAKMDLDVVVIPRAESQMADAGTTDDRILLMWEYNADLYDPRTMRQMVDAYLRLLEDCVRRPDAALGDLRLLTEHEQERILRAYNPARAGDAGPPVHLAVAAHARANPDALAVITSSERLSYAELDRRAGWLAMRLRELGAGPERIVGICLPRGTDLIVAQLGILRAGAAYLPLDPDYPAERLAYLCADAGANMVVSAGPYAAKLPAATRRVVLEDLPGGPPPAEPPARVGPHTMAYVIYTSGSSGKPKGVVVDHGALSNLVRWHLAEFQLTSADRVSMVASPSFDASVGEIWPALAAGAALHVPDPEVRLAPRRLQAWLLDQRVTVSDLPTLLTEALLVLPWPADTALRYMISGGDRLRIRPAAGLPFQLANSYGPTESTCMVTCGPVVPAAGLMGAPDIGRPIPGTTAYVLDAELRPVPVGVPGELHLGGAGLARGYLNRPALTAQRFVPDPFASGGRLYRTGDLVRHNADGALEFLGRTDAQIKIRGFRIEPGEIVAALLAHPAVADAHVTARLLAGSGDPQLVGYLVAAPGAAQPSPPQLREHLVATLPAHMVPSRYAWLPALPLTRNGKIDERALPEPPAPPIAVNAAPDTALERRLVEIWRQVLGIERVGVHDSFFDLGGHSLQLGQVHHLLVGELKRDLPMLDLFQHPTIHALARHLEGGARDPGPDRGAELAAQRAEARGRLSRRRGNLPGQAP